MFRNGPEVDGGDTAYLGPTTIIEMTIPMSQSSSDATLDDSWILAGPIIYNFKNIQFYPTPTTRKQQVWTVDEYTGSDNSTRKQQVWTVDELAVNSTRKQQVWAVDELAVITPHENNKCGLWTSILAVTTPKSMTKNPKLERQVDMLGESSHLKRKRNVYVLSKIKKKKKKEMCT